MTTDEIEIFRRGRPEAAPYDPVSKARARARLVDDPGPRRRPRWAFAASIATAGALTAGTFLLNAAEPPGSGPGVVEPSLRPVNAVVYLEEAAQVVEQRPERRPRADQWLYQKFYLKDGDGSMDKFSESWTRVDGRFAVSKDGLYEEIVIDEQYPRKDELQTALGRYDHLQTLSVAPEELLAWAYRSVDDEYAERRAEAEKMTDEVLKEMSLSELTEDGRHQAAFRTLAELFEGVLTPPRLHAAAFRAIAKVPGVQVLPKSTDLLGRRVVTIARVNEHGVRHEHLVDPETYADRGMGSVVVRNDTERRHGEVLRGRDGRGGPLPGAKRRIGESHYELRAAAGIVDKPGQLPG